MRPIIIYWTSQTLVPYCFVNELPKLRGQHGSTQSLLRMLAKTQTINAPCLKKTEARGREGPVGKIVLAEQS